MTGEPGTNPPAGGERRLGLRRTLVVRQVRLEADREVFFGYATSLSTGGLYIPTMTPRSPGTRVHLRFELPDGRGSIDSAAEVAWRREFHADTCRNPGMGVKFIDLPADSAARIRDFLDREPPDASADAPKPDD